MAKDLNTRTTTASGAVVGRPRKQAPAEAAHTIQTMAKEGRPLTGIALMMGTSFETLKRWLADDQALQHAFDLGREQRRHELEGYLLRDAKDGERGNGNAIFLLKSRYGYREDAPAEQASRVNIVFNLPESMSMADFRKVIDGRPGR